MGCLAFEIFLQTLDEHSFYLHLIKATALTVARAISVQSTSTTVGGGQEQGRLLRSPLLLIHGGEI